VSEKSIHELQDLVKKIALKDKIEESREFAVDVQHKHGKWRVGEGPLGWAAGPVEASLTQTTDALDPDGDLALQLV